MARVRCKKGLALLGQLSAARGAAKQRGVQLFLQPRQRPADARDGLAQGVGCGRDRTAVHHRHKGLQFFQRDFHGASWRLIVDFKSNINGA